MEIVLAGLSLLAVLVPVLMKAYYSRKIDGEKTRRVLLDRDISQLRADLDKLRARQTPPPVP